MRPGQRPGAKLAVFPQHRHVPVVHDGGDLRVAKLAEVIVAAVQSARPAEEDVACRLHEALARHDPLAVVLVQGLAGVGLEHRLPRLLDLQENRIVVGRHEQSEGAERADAADADDLDREVEQVEAVEQRPDVLGQGLPIAFERLGVSRLDARGLLLGGVEDQRRLVLDPWRGRPMLDELGEQAVREAFPARLLDSLPDALNLARPSAGP